jgi:hypothetical protein
MKRKVSSLLDLVDTAPRNWEFDAIRIQPVLVIRVAIILNRYILSDALFPGDLITQTI